MHKLVAGDGYAYLTRQVAAGDAELEAGGSLTEYYEATGNPPGRWQGRGRAGLGVDELTRRLDRPRPHHPHFWSRSGRTAHRSRPKVVRDGRSGGARRTTTGDPPRPGCLPRCTGSGTSWTTSPR